MQYSEAKLGRVFVLRLENGDVVHTTIETFAREHDIKQAAVLFLGAAQKGSRMVSGPKSEFVRPMPVNINVLNGVYETFGTGTMFPNEAGEVILHMHAAFGNKTDALTGCVRAGVEIWNVGEVVIWELLELNGIRALDEKTGFELLTFK